MDKKMIVTALDLGSNKVCAVIAEIASRNKINIIGVGESLSEGMRHGVVINLDKTVSSIKNAIHDAEVMAGVQAGPVNVGVTGEHIKGIASKGVISITSREQGITIADVERVKESAKGIAIPAEREIIHTLTQDFIVDNQPNIIDPVGLMGMRLEAIIYIITASSLALGNIKKAVEGAGLSVDSIILQHLASSYAVLDEEDRQQGIALLDIGGGVTNISLWFGGSLRDIGLVKLGGDSITRDISMGLATSYAFAEKIKREKASAHPSYVDPDEVIDIQGTAGRSSRKVTTERLHDVVEARIEEIIDFSFRKIQRSEYAHNLASGVVITGGTANLKGIVEVAEEIFELPVRVGTPENDLLGMVEAVSSPAFSTPIGLIKYSISGNEETEFRGEKEKKKNMVGGLKKWLSDFF
ncbi:cell division protein FtsA [candidate division WOR-3 bacterium]|nr:cell division protein FtsA [candidate division WOR-3 bacterium]